MGTTTIKISMLQSSSGHLIPIRNERPVLLTRYLDVKKKYRLGEFAALIATLAT